MRLFFNVLDGAWCKAVLVFTIYYFPFFCSPIVKEAVEMSTDEESDSLVVSHPNASTEGCDEVISSSHGDESSEGQVTSCVKEPVVEGDTQEDKCINQDSLKLIDQEKPAPPKPPAKSASYGTERPKRAVPQPFSISSQRRSSGGNGGMTPLSVNKEKSGDKTNTSPASMTKKVCDWHLYISCHVVTAYIIYRQFFINLCHLLPTLFTSFSPDCLFLFFYYYLFLS
jgi:hypothetical protein